MLRLKIVHHFLHVQQKLRMYNKHKTKQIIFTLPCNVNYNYNLIEYSDNYSDTSGNLWHFKRDEIPANNADLTNNII